MFINVNYEYKIAINDNLNKIREIISEFIEEYDFELSLIDEICMTSLLKFFELKLELSACDRLLDKLYLIIDVISVFKSCRILVLVGLNSYFSYEELEEFYKYCRYNKVMILSINSMCYNEDMKLSLIIDDDLCVF